MDEVNLQSYRPQSYPKAMELDCVVAFGTASANTTRDIQAGEKAGWKRYPGAKSYGEFQPPGIYRMLRALS